MKRTYIELRRSIDRMWYVVVVAGNGEDMLVSELYTRKGDAKRAAKTLNKLIKAGEPLEVK